MKKVNLIVNTNRIDYCQSDQKSDINFSPVLQINDGTYEELMYRFRCRDYWGEILLAAHLETGFCYLYSLSIDRSDPKMNLDQLMISITLGERSFNNLYGKVKIIRSLEKIMGIPVKDRTKFLRTQYNGENPDGDEDDDDHTFYEKCYRLVVISSKEWLRSPLLLNFYTAVLRLMTYDSEATNFDELLHDLKDIDFHIDHEYVRHLSGLYPYATFLKNYEYIIQDDPLTGLDDNIKEAFETDMYVEVKTVYKGVNIDGSYSVEKTHDASGIYSLFSSLEYIRKYPITNPFYNVGAKWAINTMEVYKNETTNESKNN